MNKYKKLASNSILFAIGNLGSKVITILLVPLYTFYLSTSEYGVVDLTLTTVSLCVPVVSLSIYDAVFRFTMEKNKNKEKILTNAVFVSIVGIITILLIGIIVVATKIYTDSYFIIVLLILSLQVLNESFAQYLRGIGKIKLFVVNGLIQTFTIGALNIIFIVFLSLAVNGYFYALLLSNLLSFLFLFFAGHIRTYIHIKNIDIKFIRSMLVYSIPLIPNSIMWWMINSSTRYFLYYFIGSSANGIFAVASKIPSLLSIITTIFFQAWQLSAVEEYDSENKSEFYSNTFKYYYQVLFLVSSIILVILKPLLMLVVENSFFISWKVVPFLLLSVVYSSFSTFLGTNYIAAKKTSGVFTSSLIGAGLSLILNLILIPVIGIQGAGIASAVSFFMMWVIRVFDTRKFIHIKINKINFILNNILFFLQIFVLFTLSNNALMVIQICIFGVILFMNKDILQVTVNLKNRKRNGV